MIDIKLIISCHNSHPLLRGSDSFVHVQTGRAVSPFVIEGTVGDDSGENISDRNDKYNELTAQYWAWKNYSAIGNPEYVGFMHYRRHFLFDDMPHGTGTWLPDSSVWLIPFLTDRYFKNFSDEKLLAAIDGYDCITLPCYDVKKLDLSTVCDQYCTLPEQERRFWDVFIQSARKLSPDYASAINRLEFGSEQYLCNMFIMKKELFFRYCEFLFPILEDIERQINTVGFSVQKSRFCGYFGEFLLSIFCFKLHEEGIWNLKELQGTFVVSNKAIPHAYFKYMACRILSKVTFGKVARYLRKKKMWYRQYCNRI